MSDTTATWTHTMPSDVSATFVQLWCICGATVMAEIIDGVAALACECGRSWSATYGAEGNR